MKNFTVTFLVIMLITTGLRAAADKTQTSKASVPPAGILPPGENAFISFKVMLPLGTNGALQEVTRRIEFPQNDTEAAQVLQDQIDRQQRVLDNTTIQNNMNLPYAQAALPLLKQQLTTVKQRLSEEGKTEAESKKVVIHKID